MSLKDYQGPANSAAIFASMVGETVKACFEDDEGRVWFVVESGHALVIGTGTAGFTVYWRERPEEVRRLVGRRRDLINQKIAELRDMAGVDLPSPDSTSPDTSSPGKSRAEHLMEGD